MNPEIFESTLNSLQEKLGDEIVAKIADDIGIFKTAQNQALSEHQELLSKLQQAEKDRSDMQMANTRLLQQIPMHDNVNRLEHQEVEQKPKEVFDYRSIFDQYGKIKS